MPSLLNRISMDSRKVFENVCAVAALTLCLAADGSWLTHVPDAERVRANPFAGQTEAIGAGKKVFEDHCTKCHGDDALGRKKKPSLRSARVQSAKDGEIFWLLRNGNLKKGMPTWAALPEPTRWQIIAYVKSLGEASMLERAMAPE